MNSSLSTSVVDVYAAGDCCRYTHGLLDRYNVDDEDGEVFRSDCDNVHASHWFQMKLWTQVCILCCHYLFLID